MSHAEHLYRLTLTEGQARALIAGSDLYTRLGIGQIEEVAELLRLGTVPMALHPQHQGERQEAPIAVIEQVEEHLQAIKALLGYPSNGSHGIGHPDNHISVSRSYEVMKVLEKAVSEGSEVPSYAVSRDGLLVRYTADAEPLVERVVTVPHPGEADDAAPS
tara:strand:+ start:2330 stop:2812 length:483 start_codon:yes stop_codon:yes gene_type:complete